MIYLQLFLTFLGIGAVSFGGGVGMISLIREQCLSNGWLTEEELMNFIAVSESTPGPIAVNIATFVGASQGNILGAMCATVGVVLPSFIIILLIAVIMKKLLEYAGVKSFLDGTRPVIIGLIIATALTMFLNVILNITTIKSQIQFDYRALIILIILSFIAILYKKGRKRSIPPVLLILISAILGILFYMI